MTLAQIETRYKGIQTKLKYINDYGCLFLCLCTIIEEVTGEPADIIGIIQWAKNTKVAGTNKFVLGDDFTVNDTLALLNHFTGKTFKRKEVKDRPSVVKDNEFTIEIWKKTPDAKEMHFKRRFVDTLINSQTVKNGLITGYYIYYY